MPVFGEDVSALLLELAGAVLDLRATRLGLRQAIGELAGAIGCGTKAVGELIGTVGNLRRTVVQLLTPLARVGTLELSSSVPSANCLGPVSQLRGP